MQKTQNQTIRILLILLLFIIFQAEQIYSQITGAQYVCRNQCYTYTYTPTANVNAEFWVLTYGSESDTLFSDQLNEILICFTENGPFELTAYSEEGEPLGNLMIFMGEFTEILMEVISPSACSGQIIDQLSQTCLKICESSLVTLRIKDLNPEEIYWSFSGNGEIIDSDNRQITIQFFEGIGSGWISYYGQIREGCFFEGGTCFEIVEKPVASFISFPGAENDTITVCRGQTISFTSTSAAKNIEWYSGSASSGEGNSFSLEYNESGFFEVTQKVSEVCDCEDLKTVVVQVLDADAPVIYCTGSVCMGDTVTYRTDPSCTPYIWEFNGSADILAGGGPSDDFVQVHWTGGASGTVSLTTDCHEVCPFPATEQIFILGNETRIQGPDKICPLRTYSFSVDNRDGTTFQWSAGFGAIQKGNGTNEISVTFFNSPQQPWVSVYIEDCTRECVQTDTLWLNLTTPLVLNGPNRLCPGEEAVYTLESNSSPVAATWEVRDENGNLIAEEPILSGNFSFSPPNGGTYTIIATPGNDIYCNPFASITLLTFNVSSANPVIEGQHMVCPGAWYTYSVEVPDGEPLSVSWEVHNGAVVTEYFSSEINIQWSEGTDKVIRVQWTDIFSGCASEWVEIPISEIEEIEIFGQDSRCIFSESSFSIDSNLIGEVSWELSIPSMGTIIEQEDQTTVIVRWNQSGRVELTARHCELAATFEIEVLPERQPVIENDEVCRGGLASITPTEDFTEYLWFSEGVEICNQPICELGLGNYLLVVEDEFGCRGRTRFMIKETSLPQVRIINLDPAGICVGDSVRIISSMAFDPDFTFTWFRNDIPIAFDTDTIIIGEFGTYRLEVSHNFSNCISRSLGLIICENCDPETLVWNCGLSLGGGATPDDYPIIFADYMAIGDCRNLQFTATFTGLIDSSVQWIITDGDSTFILSGNPVDHYFSSVGTHFVRVSGKAVDAAGDTIQLRSRLLIIRLDNLVDFDFLRSCENEPMEFQSFITPAAADSLIGVEWNFGDPASGLNNTSTDLNPAHVYASAGLYDVVLIAEFGSCSLAVEKPVEVRPVPDAGFVVEGIACSGNLVSGIAHFSEGFFEWNFLHDEDPLLVHDKNNPGLFRYDSAGTFEIQLWVEDLFGCTNSQIETLEINEFTGNPEIVADRPFPLCEGDRVELTVIGGNFSDFLWSNGSEDSTTTAESSGLYSVTVRDENNCLAASDPFPVTYEPTPVAEILGRIPGQTGIIRNDTLSVCFGTPVELFSILEENNHSFSWNTADDMRILAYDGSENPFLDPGLYLFEITIQNIFSGCESESAPFYVRIFPVPATPEVTTLPDGILCSEDLVQMEILNPDAALDYFWSSGDSGTAFSTTNAGLYFVTAENEWGCRAESAPVVINASPATHFFPKGCMEECDEITICIPIPQGYQITEWIRDGENLSLVTDPTEVVIAESGSYQVGIVNSNGCYAQSDPFDVLIFDGTANLSGIVFLDREPSGVFDPQDSLLSGILVYLWEDGNIIDSMITDENGQYLFENLPLGEYQITVSTNHHPAEWLLVSDSLTVDLALCAAQFVADPLIFIECQAEDEFFELSACSGDSIDVNGMFFRVDTVLVIEVAGANCKVVEHYALMFFPASDTVQENLRACQGFPLEWEGNTFFTDTTFVSIHQDVNGCDSVEVVEIIFLALEEEERRVQLCPDEVFEFGGQVFDRDTSFSLIIDGGGEDCGIMNHFIISISSPWEVDVSTHPACPGEEDGFADILLSGIDLNGIASIEVNGEQKNIVSRIHQLSEGDYSIVLLDTIGCERNTLFSIISDETLEVDLHDLELDCDDIGGFLQVEVISGADNELSIVWENGSTGSQLLVTEEGEYSVEVSNRCQSISLSARAFFDQAELELAYFVPNVFTPNDDGVNDEFKPLFPPDVEFVEFEFSVYDRWGKRVFQSKDPAFGWDGITEEQLSDQAVFVWVLDVAVYICGRLIYVFDYSDVTVLR